jgi:hypothetical protein
MPEAGAELRTVAEIAVRAFQPRSGRRRICAVLSQDPEERYHDLHIPRVMKHLHGTFCFYITFLEEQK